MLKIPEIGSVARSNKVIISMVRKQISFNLLRRCLGKLVAREWLLAACLLESSACFTALYPFFDPFLFRARIHALALAASIS